MVLPGTRASESRHSTANTVRFTSYRKRDYARGMDLLPVTGTEIATWVFILIAVLVLVLGILLFVLGRRKANRAADAAASSEASDDTGGAGD